MKILNKQKLEKEISSLFKQLESEGSAQLNAERFNAGLTQIFEKSELTLSGGDSKLVSVLFADLRGFTSMVEKISSADITTILNEFFSTMVEIIDHHEGMLINSWESQSSPFLKIQTEFKQAFSIFFIVQLKCRLPWKRLTGKVKNLGLILCIWG